MVPVPLMFVSTNYGISTVNHEYISAVFALAIAPDFTEDTSVPFACTSGLSQFSPSPYLSLNVDIPVPLLTHAALCPDFQFGSFILTYLSALICAEVRALASFASSCSRFRFCSINSRAFCFSVIFPVDDEADEVESAESDRRTIIPSGVFFSSPPKLPTLLDRLGGAELAGDFFPPESAFGSTISTAFVNSTRLACMFTTFTSLSASMRRYSAPSPSVTCANPIAFMYSFAEGHGSSFARTFSLDSRSCRYFGSCDLRGSARFLTTMRRSFKHSTFCSFVAVAFVSRMRSCKCMPGELPNEDILRLSVS
mmetsp:Transcript_9230/g.27817  ORF Transcript_9230/g.27817 Transcript_9230/m.27817 type:complete len:310 (-) Transcript_9230:288-1217(-)